MKQLVFFANLIIALILIVKFSSCEIEPVDPGDNTEIVETNCDQECDSIENLLFNFGFESVQLTQAGTKAYFSGVDTAFPSQNNWEDWSSNSIDGEIFIQYEEGDSTQRLAQIVCDPENANNNVLSFNIIEPHINIANPFANNKSRVQLNFDNANCLKEYYQTCKMYFPTDEMNHLKQYSQGIYWLSIFEFWNNKNWGEEEDFPFRITVGFYKKPGAGEDLVLRTKADQFDENNDREFDVIWEERATDFPISFGKWMDVEMYVLEGDETTGRFYLAITPEGESKIVLFDKTGFTKHPDDDCPDGFKNIQPLKWYTNAAITNHMKNSGYALKMYWDDLVVYKNKEPN